MREKAGRRADDRLDGAARVGRKNREAGWPPGFRAI